MDANPTTYKLRRTADLPGLLVDGLVPGVDVEGVREGDQFTTADEQAHRSGLPFVLIDTFRDLDRVVGSRQAKRKLLHTAKRDIEAEIKRLDNGVFRLINWFGDLIPQPPADRKHRDSKGPVSRGNYRYANERALQWSLVDPAEARKAGLLKKTEPEEVAVGTAVLNAYYKAKQRTPPGYRFTEQQPVSFTPATDPKSTDEPES